MAALSVSTDEPAWVVADAFQPTPLRAAVIGPRLDLLLDPRVDVGGAGTLGKRGCGIAICTIVAMRGPQRTKWHTNRWEHPKRVVVLMGVLLLLASGTSAGSAAGSSYASKSCGAILVDHVRYRVFRNSTRVSCAKARRVMRQFYAGPTRSGTGSSPITLPGQPGWGCGVAAGTAICHNGRRTVRGRMF
jgi:hypothetical protein